MTLNIRAHLHCTRWFGALTGHGPEGAALQRALRDRPDLVDGMRRELGLDDGSAGSDDAAPARDGRVVVVRQTAHVCNKGLVEGDRRPTRWRICVCGLSHCICSDHTEKTCRTDS